MAVKAVLSGIHRSFFVMRHAMRQARNRENPKSQPCRGPRNCRNWAIAEVELGSTFAMRCDATSDLVYDFDLFYSKVVQRCKSCL